MSRHIIIFIFCVTLFGLFNITTLKEYNIREYNVHDNSSLCKFSDNIYLTDEVSSVLLGSNKIYWSACKTERVKGICPQNSVVCLQDLQNKENNVNLGTSFKIILDENNSGTYYLQSENGEKCKEDPKKSYVIKITFDEASFEPLLLPSPDQCVFNIRMLHPTAELPCTKRVNGFLLDFRKFTNDFSVASEKSTHIFNLCKSATGCSDSKVSSCIIGTQNQNFGEVANKRIDYNEQDGSVQFYLYSGSGKSRLTTKVDLKCDWNISYGVPKYLDSSLKTSKFIVYSPLGCIKLPMDCKHKDLTNYDYDLSKLYKSNGAWNVINDKNKIFKINICGPLENEPGNCRDQHSQICNIQQDVQLSYGSILTNKRMEGDILKAKLSYGSICPHNSSVVLTTDLSFKCSAVEKGPKLINIANCSLDILWETPEACPQRIFAATNLDIHDNLGRRNLSNLCTGDKNHTISKSSYIRYNLCTPLQKPCNSIINTSICLHNNEAEAVLGYYMDEKLYNRNGILSMEFLGETCKSFNVFFKCDYSAIDAEVALHVKHDNCAYDMHIRTTSACVSKRNLHPEENCVIRNNSMLYNLTALTRLDDNYLINGTDGKQYIMNVCNPVITGPNSLCKQEASACIHNQREPNIKYKFFSIGSQSQQLTIEGDKLSLKFVRGDWCHSNRKLTSGVIHFNCSDDHESGPILLSEKESFYEFSWTTKFACPKTISTSTVLKYSNCLISSNNKVLNLTDIQNKKFVIPYRNESNFTFNICLDNYTEIYKSGKSETFYSNRTSDGKSITFYVEKKCENEYNNWNKVNISFSCNEKDNESFELLGIIHCTMYTAYRSKSLCKEEYVANELPLITVFKETAAVFKNLRDVFIKPDVTIENKNYKKTAHKNYSNGKENNSTKTSSSSEVLVNCEIVVNRHTISLNNFTSVLIPNSENLYSIGLNSILCPGYVCKGNVTLASLKTCPEVSKADAYLKVTFNNTNLSADVFTTTIIFRCNFTMEMPKIKYESNSSLILVHPLDRLCMKLESKGGWWIIGSVILLVLIILIVVGFVYAKKHKDWAYTILRRKNKSHLNIYCRNLES